MDTAPLVVDEIEAGAEFIKRFTARQPVKGACWLRSTEDAERYLYVALDALTVANSDIAYSEVLRVAQEMKDHYIDPFRVKVIDIADPIAKAIFDIHRRSNGRSAAQFNGTVFGGSAVAEVYVYPQLLVGP